MTEINFPQPWDMQAGETEKAYKAFRIYLTLPAPRKYQPVADKLGVGIDHIKAWGRRYEWRNRARQYDVWMVGQLDRERANSLAMFQAQVVTQEVEDYQKMRATWQEVYDNLMANPTALDAGEFVDRMKKMVQVRAIIDQLARRAASLPNTYRAAEQKPQESNDQEAPMMLTMDGPRLLSEVKKLDAAEDDE